MNDSVHVGSLGKQRLLAVDRLNPKKVVGSCICLPDMRGYFLRLQKDGGWGKGHAFETQARCNFTFDAQALRAYLEKIGVKTDDIYFPAAYYGRVASALRFSGSNVFASDISGYWVNHLNIVMQLHAEKRGFEEIPDAKYGAIITFEPIAVPFLPKYIAMMRALSAGIPFVKIYSSDHLKYSYGLDELNLLWEGVPIIKSSIIPYPESAYSMDRLGYDYGAKWVDADYHYDGTRFFKAVTVIPGKNSKARAKADLLVMDTLLKCNAVSGEPASIAKYSGALGIAREKIAASFHRLIEIFNRRAMFFFGRDESFCTLLQVSIRE